MTAKTFFRNAGALRQLTKVFYRDAGVLRTIRKIYYRDAGALRLVFDTAGGGGGGGGGGGVIFIQDVVDSYDMSQQLLSFAVDGSMTGTTAELTSLISTDSWMTAATRSPANVALYEIKCTPTNLTSFGTCTGDTTGTFLDFSEERKWAVQCPFGYGTSWDLFIEIRRISDQVVVASATYNITVDRT